MAFAREQVERFREATDGLGVTRHIANSAAALRLPESRLDAARCGIAIYGLSPFMEDPHNDGLEPVLRWRSHLAQVKQLRTGNSTGLRQTFCRGDADLDRNCSRWLRRRIPPRPTGTDVRIGDDRCTVIGTISMDSFAVELDRELPVGTPVTLLGDDVLAEAHAAIARTINYELVTGINSDPARAHRQVIDG